MKSPLHPGEIIANSLGELGMSVSAAAKGLGITRQQLHNLIADGSKLLVVLGVLPPLNLVHGVKAEDNDPLRCRVTC